MTDPFRKTRTAAGYLLLNGDGDASRYVRVRRLFSALQDRDRAMATGDRKPDDAIADVLAATADRPIATGWTPLPRTGTSGG
jgi:hypothetical protein